MDEPVPTLIVVTGRSGSGKTTLSRELAQKIRCPLLSRDELKEGFVHTTSSSRAPDDAETQVLYELFFETIELLLSRKITLIAEAAFQHKLWAPKLENIQKIARIKLIICSIELEIAQERINQRVIDDPDRLKFHEQPTIGHWEEPQLAVPTLRVFTLSGYEPNLGEIVDFCLSNAP